jgi:hypothetical protein
MVDIKLNSSLWLFSENRKLFEICRGKLRSILMDRDEIAWLVCIFEELVVVEDSRVFWNQAQAGLPRIIA